MEAITGLLNHIFVVLIAASVVLGFFLALVLLRQKRANEGTNATLALLLMALSLSVVLNSYLDSFIPEKYPGAWTFPEPFLLLIGPLLLLISLPFLLFISAVACLIPARSIAKLSVRDTLLYE